MLWFLLPIVWHDVQVVSLVCSADKADAGDVMEGHQATLDDGALPRGWGVATTVHQQSLINTVTFTFEWEFISPAETIASLSSAWTHFQF